MYTRLHIYIYIYVYIYIYIYRKRGVLFRTPVPSVSIISIFEFST